MNLLIFFAIPLATILLAIVLENILDNPILVAITFFAVYLVITFALFALGTITDLGAALVAIIIYTIIAFVTAYIVRLLKCLCERYFNSCLCRKCPNDSNNNTQVHRNNLGSNNDIFTGNNLINNNEIITENDLSNNSGTLTASNLSNNNIALATNAVNTGNNGRNFPVNNLENTNGMFLTNNSNNRSNNSNNNCGCGNSNNNRNIFNRKYNSKSIKWRKDRSY